MINAVFLSFKIVNKAEDWGDLAVSANTESSPFANSKENLTYCRVSKWKLWLYWYQTEAIKKRTGIMVLAMCPRIVRSPPLSICKQLTTSARFVDQVHWRKSHPMPLTRSMGCYFLPLPLDISLWPMVRRPMQHLKLMFRRKLRQPQWPFCDNRMPRLHPQPDRSTHLDQASRHGESVEDGSSVHE